MQSGGKDNAKRVALVVGSGGVKCAAALGLWKVLQREGIEVSVAVGCSGGSIYAALIALGVGLQAAGGMTRRLGAIDIMKGYSANLRGGKSGGVRFRGGD